MHPEERLSELGLQLPEAAAPVAAYVPTVRTGDLVFVSGQVPWPTDLKSWSGKVGAEVGLEEAVEAAQAACLYGLAALKREIGDLDRLRRVIKLTVFVASAPDFIDQPKVANGASELLQEVFGEWGRHARSAVGVAELPMAVPVEVEFVFEVS